jgi:hypothetical protein
MPKFYAIDHAPHFVLVAGINVIVFVVLLLHSLDRLRGKARSGLDYGMESGWMKGVYTSVIWLVGRYLDVGIIVAKRGTIEVFAHLACEVHSKRFVYVPVDLHKLHAEITV